MGIIIFAVIIAIIAFAYGVCTEKNISKDTVMILGLLAALLFFGIVFSNES